MSWRVIWTSAAAKDLRRLPRKRAGQIRAAVRRAAETETGDLKRLHGSPGRLWRLRVGEYRVRLIQDRQENALVILAVDTRGDAYKD